MAGRILRMSKVRVLHSLLTQQNPMKKTIESKVSDTILQKSEEVPLGEKTYSVKPPTIATLIKVSELISQLPGIPLAADNPALESLAIAKDCKVLGEIIAVLILGHGAQPVTKRIKRPGFLGWLGAKIEIDADPYKEFGEEILNNSPSEVEKALIFLLKKMEIGSFFALSTSLIEVNLLKATRGVED